MASTEIERLTAQDLPVAQELVAESGWNQLPADWNLFLQHGQVFKVTGDAGVPVATAAILPYPPGFGWISMVLVRGSHRRQGLATALLSHGIAQLRAIGLVPVLDATPAGRTVYQPLGFQDGWRITRWRRTGVATQAVQAAPSDHTGTVRPLREADWPEIRALDLQAFGADRGAVLQSLAGRCPGLASVVERNDRVVAYLLARDGRQATQIGPIVAGSDDHASDLLAFALARIDGPVLLDVVEGHPAFSDLLPRAGFSVERGYVRMALDASPNSFGSAAITVAIAGPELG